MSYSVLLCLMLVFHFRYRKKISGLTGAQWARFGYFPIFSMIVIMAISMMMGSGDTERLVAVAGFDNLSESLAADLTTVSVNREELGMSAAETILWRIENPERPYRVIRISGAELIVRNSTNATWCKFAL